MDGLYLFLAFFIFAATCCYMVHRVTALFADTPREHVNPAALYDGLAELNRRMDARQRRKHDGPDLKVVRPEADEEPRARI